MTVDVEIDNRIGKCQKILGTDPNSQIFAALAEAYRKKGELEKAFQVCHNGLRIHPNYGPAHVVMAKINMDRGLYDWAEAEVEKARQVDGNNRTIELLLAEINIYKGEFQAAIKVLKRLAITDPGNDHVKRLIDIALKIPQEQREQLEPQVTTASDSGTAPKAVHTVTPPRAVVADRLTPVDLLTEALQVKDVDGAMYINTEGLVIESQWRMTIDQATCGAALAEVSKFLDQELMKISFGRVGSVLVETNNRVFYLIRVSGGMFLMVAGASVNLGSLRMKIATVMERLQTK
jgi:predicted regulator of Ras-like GTPase activity (Roadblock/LC7/MglB family)